MALNKIPTFVLNLERRKDRREHIINQFAGKDEFDLKFVNPIAEENPAISLWNTVKYIINELLSPESDFVLICEDDHTFTDKYDKDLVRHCINVAKCLNAEILSGGVSCVGEMILLEPNIMWIEKFTGLQFTIIFRRLFGAINNFEFKEYDNADIVMSNLAKRIFLLTPFISTQKEFGYSDITAMNNVAGRVDSLFEFAQRKVEAIVKVSSFYRRMLSFIDSLDAELEEVFIPTYIVNLPERKQRLSHILSQFSGRSEFEINVVKAIKHPKGNVGLWLTIRRIVSDAIEKGHDVIILCEDDHAFTENYHAARFLRNVVLANELGAGMLLGGIANFANAVPVNDEMMWVDNFYCTQFTVLYKRTFNQIIEMSFDEFVTADGAFSLITSHKLVLHPFVSIQKYYEVSDINPLNGIEGHLQRMFDHASKRLDFISDIRKGIFTTL